jgi:endo-alpha-1,4-polygalactosaminidase (GH114 family)
MIDRRAFMGGMGSLLIGGPAAAELRVNGRIISGDNRKLGDIPDTPLEQIPNHRQLMRTIVINLSTYAKTRDLDFFVLTRDAPELLVKEARESDWEAARDTDGAAAGKYTPVDSVVQPYLKAIDGLLIDGLFCGRDGVDRPTDEVGARTLRKAVAVAQREGREVLTIEYCKSPNRAATVARQAAKAKTLTCIDQTGNTQLARIPASPPQSENADHVTELHQARNFLAMFHSQAYGSRSEWVEALAATNYDLLLLDPFWRGSDPLTADDVKHLKYKRLGTARLVVATLSVGRAADTRYYWNPEWHVGNPDWLEAPDPETPTQTLVRYWDPAWEEILGGYLKAIMDCGYSGVLVDYADAYLYFEQMMPLR